MKRRLSDEESRNKQNEELRNRLEKEKEEKTKKHYVQMIHWDCLICHKPVGIGQDEEGKKFVMCECMVYPASDFFNFKSIDIIWEFDKFSETITRLEEWWASEVLELKSGVKVPHLFTQSSHDFFDPYQEAHSQWMQEHPMMICECPDCEGGCNGDPYGIEADEEPAVSKPKPEPNNSAQEGLILTQAKRKFQQVELAL
jgi:hypothetical protein